VTCTIKRAAAVVRGCLCEGSMADVCLCSSADCLEEGLLVTCAIRRAAAAVVPGCLCEGSMADYCLCSTASCLEEGL